MTVTRLELEAPDPGRARTLLVDLLGGVPRTPTEDGELVVDAPGGARFVVRPGTEPRAVPVRLALATDAHVPDMRGLLGVEVVAAAPDGHVPADPAPRGAAGTLHLDHVCFAVSSLRAALEVLCDGLGGHVVFGGHERTNGTLSSQVDIAGGTRVELLEPTRPDAAVARFLDRFGPGLHHLTWKVAEVETTVAAAEAHGFPTTGTDLDRRPHWRETYLRPSGALGLLVQLAWTSRSYTTPLDPATIERILAGEVPSHDYGMQLDG